MPIKKPVKTVKPDKGFQIPAGTTSSSKNADSAAFARIRKACSNGFIVGRIACGITYALSALSTSILLRQKCH